MATPMTIALLRFDQVTGRPVDDAGNLDALAPDAGTPEPTYDDAFAGRGARFTSDEGMTLIAKDLVSGSTLAQRDCSIQAILAYDVDGQMAVPSTGTIIARGKGTAAAEYTCWALQLRVLDQATRRCEVRWLWQTSAGVDKAQIGAHFTAPEATGFFMLTATRLWVSSTEVELRYYLGPLLIGEVMSTDGDIGGGTTGTTSVGVRYTGGSWNDPIAATLDEIRVANYELAPEEIEATWNRIAVYQPDGYRQIRAALPPGWPLSSDPSSQHQRYLRTIGTALGFADAQIEHLRANLMPDRAFGEILERWERIAGEVPRASDSLARRRARVLSHLADPDGCSSPGVRGALAEALATSADLLEVVAFDGTFTDDLSAGLRSEVWRVDPAAAWDVTGGALRCQAAIAADLRWDGATYLNARTALLGLEPYTSITALKLTLTALPDGGEAGVVLWQWAHGDALWFGVRRTGAVYQVGYQRYEGWAATGAFTVLAATAAVPHWLIVRQQDGGLLGAGRAFYTLSWSTTSATSGFTDEEDVEWVNNPGWIGPYLRSTIAAFATAADVRFDDIATRQPRALRPFRWYVYRNPALPGTPDYAAANRVLRAIRQAQTHAYAISAKSFFPDASLCDGGPLGGV